MNFKDKIIAAIKAKFPAVNLSKKRLDAIADKIQEKVIDDETKIDAAIDTFNDYNSIAEIGKQDDIQRGLEKKVKEGSPKKEDKPADSGKPDQGKPTEDPDDNTPSWAKTLIESNKTLAGEIAVLKGEKQANIIRSQVKAKLTEVPESYWGEWALPEKDEDVDAFVTKATEKYTAFTKELTEKGLDNIPTPGAGGTGGSGKAVDKTNGGKASKEEIADITKAIM